MEAKKLQCRIQGFDQIRLPRMRRVRQKFTTQTIEDPSAALKKELLEKIGPAAREQLKGKRIGITAGSRGVPSYKELMKTMVDQLREWGAQPFVFPAMGSHAGATGEGQKAYLAQFGLTEEYLGVPILSSMDVVEVARLDDGFPVYCDKNAFEADGIILFNKIKPHTHFRGSHESGLLKMICIGAGKHLGAATFHQYGFDHFEENMIRVSNAFLENINVVFALGIVQNKLDEIGWLELIPRDQIFERDAALLTIAKEDLIRLPFDKIDVLVIDQVGKEISGVGFDPNVSGRIEVLTHQKAFRDQAPDIKKIVLLDITDYSHGLGIGMGEADIVSWRFIEKLDLEQTYTNVITNNYLHAAAIPLYMNSDEDAIKLAVLTAMLKDRGAARIVRIKNTISMEEMEVSEGIFEETDCNDRFEVLSDPYDLEFNGEGNLW